MKQPSLRQFTHPLRKFAFLRQYLAPILIALTIGFFVYFFKTHASVRKALLETSPWVLLEVAGLYALFMLSLVWVYDVTLRFCGKQLGVRENVLLTCYSTIANFFGPLQSGPGVRAAYLKQKHRVKLRDYTLASLLYYACYAIVSALFVLIGSGRYWPIALGLVILVTIGSLGIVWFARRQFGRRGQSRISFPPSLVARLFVATICQLVVMMLIYYVELRAVHTGASLLQAVAYGGAANFALFVALTPGAIGFREAFLGFSQQIHHIGTPGILAASVIDRAVFVAFLGLSFLLILGVHADRRFRVKFDKPVKD